MVERYRLPVQLRDRRGEGRRRCGADSLGGDSARGGAPDHPGLSDHLQRRPSTRLTNRNKIRSDMLAGNRCSCLGAAGVLCHPGDQRAEKAADIKVVDFRMIGATGRVYLSGTEADVCAIRRRGAGMALARMKEHLVREPARWCGGGARSRHWAQGAGTAAARPTELSPPASPADGLSSPPARARRTVACAPRGGAAGHRRRPDGFVRNRCGCSRIRRTGPISRPA